MQRSGHQMPKNCGTNQRICSTDTKTINRKDARNPKKIVVKWLILLAMLALALYFYKDSMQEILSGIKALSAVQLSVSLLCGTGFFLTEGFIVFYMVHPFADNYRWHKGIITALICEFYRILTLGSGTGFAEIYYLQKDGVSYPTGTGTTLLQFVQKKIGVMLLGLIGFFYLLGQKNTSSVLCEYRTAMAAGCIITMVIVIFMLAITLSGTVKNLLFSLLKKAEQKFPRYHIPLQKWQENVLLLNEAGKTLLTHKRRFLIVIALNLWKLFLIYLIPAYILSGQCSLSFLESTMLMAVSYMLAGVIPTPSGIASLEFVFLLLFTRFADKATAVPAILVFRFVTWMVPFAIGGVCLFLKSRKNR